jgi:magnesium-transporting ATPase (P-type)
VRGAGTVGKGTNGEETAAPGEATSAAALRTPHAVPAEVVLRALESTPNGLDRDEARARLARFGPNVLPHAEPPTLAAIFLRQFLNPLIYILLAATVVSLAIGEWADAGFILAVLVSNAAIGSVQEYNAQRSAEALQGLVVTRAYVVRGGEEYEVEAGEIVPGDVVLLESGAKVPADLRLLGAGGFAVDESLLTGESLPVVKDAAAIVDAAAGVADRVNLAFAGTLVARGRARAVVVRTGARTEVGRLATSVPGERRAQAPLLVRMESFTAWIGISVGVAVSLMAAIALLGGAAPAEIFLLAVGLAVSAIPEGLPVALTVALAIATSRMGRRNVIVRRLVAVESLGSCTYIASDKTGTLTLNEMTVRRIVFPGEEPWEVTGQGMTPEGEILPPAEIDPGQGAVLIERLAETAVLCNEGFLGKRDGQWVHHGDTVDVALLVLAHKRGISRGVLGVSCPQVAAIPFESAQLFAASANRVAGETHAFVKGAVERLLSMCGRMATRAGDVRLDRSLIEAQAHGLAAAGYRVLALARGPLRTSAGGAFSAADLADLTFVGLVGMIDPLRPEAKEAVAACRRAGIEVAMVTGDHPVTALAIARELGLADAEEQIVTGPMLAELRAESAQQAERAISQARVFARVEPSQKLQIVNALGRGGHFVAVTGDGANDAPALRAAHVGVAMGKRGTDVARETADLILTDDNFASIVAGIEEGRIAYANVRKVIYLLVSTGAAELVLFFFAMLGGLPMPLFPVQLLWLNLVTNGIQDVALAFEPGEGDELQRRPRPPRERIFDRSMIERCLLSALVMGGVTYAAFSAWLAAGVDLASARNGALLLLVLFENVQIGNARSERRSAFALDPRRNLLLLFGTVGAQLIHVGAMYVSGVRDVLRLQPVTLRHWIELFACALSVLVAMELYKLARRGRTR